MSHRTRVDKTNSKSSDRRLASGIRPESFLLSQQKNSINVKPTTPVPSHNTTDSSTHSKFKLFVGNLGPDANTVIVSQAFSAYRSVAKVEVPIGPKNTNKGYAFVSFGEADDYLKAFRELQGKHIGLYPCVLKRATDQKDKKQRKHNKRK